MSRHPTEGSEAYTHAPGSQQKAGKASAPQQQARVQRPPQVSLAQMTTMQRSTLMLMQEHMHQDRAANYVDADRSPEYFEEQNEAMRVQMSHLMHEQRVEENNFTLPYSAWETLFEPVFEAKLRALSTDVKDEHDLQKRWQRLWGTLWAALWELTRFDQGAIDQALEEHRKGVQLEAERLEKKQIEADEIIARELQAEEDKKGQAKSSDSDDLAPVANKPAWMTSKSCNILSGEQLAFFHKYGFVVIKGLHSKSQLKKAHHAAEELISKAAEALDGGKGEQAFELARRFRSALGRCTEPNLTHSDQSFIIQCLGR